VPRGPAWAVGITPPHRPSVPADPGEPWLPCPRVEAEKLAPRPLVLGQSALLAASTYNMHPPPHPGEAWSCERAGSPTRECATVSFLGPLGDAREIIASFTRTRPTTPTRFICRPRLNVACASHRAATEMETPRDDNRQSQRLAGNNRVIGRTCSHPRRCVRPSLAVEEVFSSVPRLAVGKSGDPKRASVAAQKPPWPGSRREQIFGQRRRKSGVASSLTGFRHRAQKGVKRRPAGPARSRIQNTAVESHDSKRRGDAFTPAREGAESRSSTSPTSQNGLRQS